MSQVSHLQSLICSTRVRTTVGQVLARVSPARGGPRCNGAGIIPVRVGATPADRALASLGDGSGFQSDHRSEHQNINRTWMF